MVSSDETAEEMYGSMKIINHQAWRLNRLIEDLFLSEQARTGKLTLTTQPFDLSRLVKKVSDEITEHLQNQKTATQIQPGILVVGDEGILEHAIWALYTCAANLSKPDSALTSEFRREKENAIFRVQLIGSVLDQSQLEAMFHPFSTVEFERGSKLRSAVSLHLSRAVAHLHHGTIQIVTSLGQDPALELVLPTLYSKN